MLKGAAFGCRQADYYGPPPVAPGMNGTFTNIINAVGAAFGVPGAGNMIASKAPPGFAPVTQSNTEIATQVAPDVINALTSNAATVPTPIPGYYQNLAYEAAPDIARELARRGYMMPPGTQGAEYQNPSIFDAFGGENKGAVQLAAIGLAGFLALKIFRR